MLTASGLGCPDAIRPEADPLPQPTEPEAPLHGFHRHPSSFSVSSNAQASINAVFPFPLWFRLP